MAWPPPVLPTTRTDTTTMASTHPADHNAANLAINDIVARITGTAWTAPAFANGWLNVGGAAQVLQYRSVGDDLVQVRGTIKPGALNNTVTTLPAGFRPPAEVRLPAGDAATIVVYPAGQINLFAVSGTTFGLNFQFSTKA